jgi:hypothetical protein
MWKSIENSRETVTCQWRKSPREQTAPLGEIEESRFPFEIIHMVLTGPYNLKPRGNKYLLTFDDRLSRYVEEFPTSSTYAEKCARISAAHILTRHGTGCKLITDQGRNFVLFLARNL